MLLPLLLLACAGADPKGDDTATPDEAPAFPPLVINEFLALNETVNGDEGHDADDWIELYNPSDAAVSLEGLYLSDVGLLPAAALPSDVSVEAGGFLLVWCDGEAGVAEDTGGGSYVHAELRLDGVDGETLRLVYAPDGVTPYEMDAVAFGMQQPDISGARVPDGGVSWEYTTPTPGASNGTGD